MVLSPILDILLPDWQKSHLYLQIYTQKYVNSMVEFNNSLNNSYFLYSDYFF